LAALFSSDLTRARRSAEIIGAPHGLAPTIVPALREMDMGRWDGLTAGEIRAREPEAFADWMARVGEFPFPEGESVPDLLARVGPAFDAIAAATPARRSPSSPTAARTARCSAAPSACRSAGCSRSARTTAR
jgi:broad specificity phosphatase PhoE